MSEPKAETKIVKIKEPKGDSPENLIALAIKQNAPIETLERLFDLQKRVNEERSKTAFISAMSEFQSKCPVIKKTKKVMNKDGHTVRYMFAPIDSIVEQIKKPLAESGLSYRWEAKQDKLAVKAVCIVTHELGHSESSEFEIPIDLEGFMTQPQKYASALTFAKRYSLCNALGISTGDEDTDATDVGKEKTAKSPKAKIVFLLRQLGSYVDDPIVIKEKVKALTTLELTPENYEEIVGRLEITLQEKNESTEIR